MLKKVSFVVFATLLASACSESNFKGGTTTAQAPKAADSVVEETKIPTKPAAPVPETVTAEKTLKDKCDAGVGMKVLEQKITFPETYGCDFAGHNVKPIDRRITITKTTSATLNLPQGEVCDMSVESASDATFHYDDILIFSFDKYLLFSSTDTLMSYYPRVNNFLQFDESKIKDFELEFDGKAICLDNATPCVIPKTDTTGKFEVGFPFASIASLIQLYKGQASVPLNLTVTGDNDDKDCSHSKLDLLVKMKYVP